MANSIKFIILEDFLTEHKISFRSERSKISWVRSLNPKTLIKVGTSFFVEESEIEKLFMNHLMEKTRSRRNQIANGKRLAKSNQEQNNQNTPEDQQTLENQKTVDKEGTQPVGK